MNSILLPVLLFFSAPSFEIQTVDEQSLSGAVTRLTTEEICVLSANGTVTLPVERILKITAKGPVKPTPCTGITVYLRDGSLICCCQYVSHNGKGFITLAEGEILEAPLELIQAVGFQSAAAQTAELSRSSPAKTAGDLLLVETERGYDSHPGVIHDVSEDVVHFELDGEILPVKRSKIIGIVYHHAASEEPTSPVCWITDAGGSRWAVQSMSLSGRLSWITAGGLTVSQPLENIREIDFSLGKLVYLSDLKPEAVEWTPFFGGERLPAAMRKFYMPRFDQGFASPALRLGGTEYHKGLALHSRTELVYRLDGGYRRFQATVGIEDAVRPAGKVRLIIRGDERVVFDGELSGGDSPKPLALDVSGVRRLTILVDFGDGLSAGDRLLLCEARVVR